MSTLATIKSDILEARKARDGVKANVLNTLLAELCRDTKEPSDDQVTRGVVKFVKNLDKTLEIQSTPKLVEERAILVKYEPVVEAFDIDTAAAQLIAENADKWEICKEKPQNLGWFVGQIMKISGGKANPATIKGYFESKI